MRYWDASGIVPLLVRQARTRDMERLSEAAGKEGFVPAVHA